MTLRRPMMNRRLHGLARAAWLSMVTAGVLLCTSTSSAQQSGGRQIHGADSPPGVVAFHRMLRGPAQVGHYQAIQIFAPAGSEVWLWNGYAFQNTGQSQPVVAMQVGYVYRIKVTSIPNEPGLELFPSIEVLHRLFPPPGVDQMHPIQVLLDISDLTLAADGNLVTRVVYLESPDTAIPFAQRRGDQEWFDVSAGDDPLQVADRLGKAMVITRIGSRVPDMTDMHAFDFGGPPVQLLQRGEPANGGDR